MNELLYIDEFHRLLTSYHISNESIDILNKTKLVLLTGPSASGRNTIIYRLLKTKDYYYIISDTTRQPRYNNGQLEKNGREYWFRQEKDMLQDIRQGKFLEAEIIHDQQVSGISIRELEVAYNSRKVAINEVDIGGIQNIMKLKKDVIAILLLPPSFAVWQKRLRERGDMHPNELQRRLKTAIKIFSTYLDRPDQFKVIINNDINDAVKQVNNVVRYNQIDLKTQKQSVLIAQKLLNESEKYLSCQLRLSTLTL